LLLTKYSVMENPYSTEIRYSSDLLAYFLQKSQAKRVRIATLSNEIAKSIIRRIFYQNYELIVENEGVQQSLLADLGVKSIVHHPDAPPVDAGIFPFSFPQNCQPDDEPFIYVACQNSLSYKSILHPGKAGIPIYQTLGRLSELYSLDSVTGIYSPRFVIFYALAKLVERLNSAWYFRLEDIAMCRIIDFSPLWRLSYIVVFTGRITG
jgi:hypothetical protein